MNLLTKPWLAAVLIVLVQPVVAVLLVWKSAPAMVAALVAVAAQEEPVRPKEARPPWNMWTPEIEQIAAELKAVRMGLQEREQTVIQREARLAAEQAALGRTRKELELQRAEIGRLLTEIGVDELKNLKSLAQTYSVLSPKGTVAIFTEMDDTTVVKILALMKSDVVGPVFEEMSKDKSEKNNQAQRAAVLSERLRLMKSSKPAAGGN